MIGFDNHDDDLYPKLRIHKAFEGFTKLRALLSNQKNLKLLHLIKGDICSIFRTSLEIQSTLEDFKLSTRQWLMRDIQINYCDFINSQDLSYLECKFYVEEPKTAKMIQFFAGRLNMPLRFQNIQLHRFHYSGNHSVGLEDFLNSAFVHHNSVTEKLFMKIDLSYASVHQVVPHIAKKFPNLKSILFTSIGSGGVEHQFDDLEEIEKKGFQELIYLRNLESLTLWNFQSGYLSSIQIPSLRLRTLNYDCLRLAESNDLLDFLSRHEKIKELCIPHIVPS